MQRVLPRVGRVNRHERERCVSRTGRETEPQVYGRWVLVDGIQLVIGGPTRLVCEPQRQVCVPPQRVCG